MKIKKATPLIKPSELTFPKDYSPVYTGLTQSMLGNYLQCKRKFLLTVNRWSYPSDVMKFWFGDMVHESLQQIYLLKQPPNFSDIERFTHKYFAEFMRQNPMLDRGAAAKDLMIAQILLDEYTKFYANDFKAKQKRIEYTEHTFDIKLRYGLGHRLRGKIDLKFKDKNGDPWIMEHKTKSRIDETSIVSRLSLDIQNLFYLIADEIETGKAAKGVLYNILRRPQNKPGKNERLQQFGERVRKEIQKDTEYYFIRYEIIYTQQDRERFRKDLDFILWEIHNTVLGTFPAYKNPKSCIAEFKCPFLEACSTNSLIGYKQKDSLFTELDEV